MDAPNHLIELYPLRLDLRAGQMWKGEQSIKLRPKSWDLISYMARKPGELLSKQQLMDAVWPDTFVTESSLNQEIKEIRKALGDNARAPRFIETVHRRGFRLLHRDNHTAMSIGGEAAEPPASLFGRSSELDALTNALDLAHQGHGQLVFITGEPGIGKTTLVRQFVDHLTRPDGLALGWGQCYDLQSDSEAYLPFLESLDRLARGHQGKTVQKLLSLYAPSWHAQFPWMSKPDYEIDHRLLASTPARMLREFCDFIERMAEQAPVLLWLEDLHWSDAGTVDLLEILARRGSDSRMLLIASYRPVDAAIKGAPVAHLKRSLEARGLARELPLEFLEKQDVGQIVAERLGSRELPRHLSELLYEQTSGNPLFVSTALDHLLAEGMVAKQDEAWVLKEPIEKIRSSCPESLRHIINLQRSGVSSKEAPALDAASAAGHVFDTQAVAGALEADPLEVETVLDSLASRRQFLRRAGTANWPDGSSCRRYEFIHDVFHESIYQSLAPGQRQAFHRKIAVCLDEGFSDDAGEIAAELALHAELGGDRERAIRFLELAARRAQTLNAPREALAYLDRALFQIAAMPSSTERDRRELNILLRAIPALIAAESFTSDRLPGQIDRALALCDRQDDSVSRLRVLVTKISVEFMPGDWKKLEARSHELIAAGEAVNDPLLRVHPITLSADMAFARGDVARSRELFQAAIALLEPEDLREPAEMFGHDPTVSAMGFMALTEWMLGRSDQAQDMARRIRRRAEAVGAAQSIATAQFVSMNIALHRGELDEARRFWNALRHCLDRNGLEYCYMRPLAARTLLLVREGRPDEAIREARDGISLARERRTLAFSSISLTALAEAQLAAGQIDDGLASIKQALAHAARVGERIWRPESLRIRAGLLLAQGALQKAEKGLRKAVREAGELSLLALELRASHDLAQLLCDQGRSQEAQPILESVVGRCTEGFSTADYRKAQSLLSSCRLPAAR
jgi:DNA-binding winged helix-turn-helix (wHTH) protein/tetratricopeptide (TPR) repeat protein